MMSRRQFLRGMGAAGLAAGLAGCKYWPEQGLANPCKSVLPPELARHEVVRAAWEGLDAAKVWDSHVHIAGVGDSGSGIRVNPDMDSLLHPLQYAQKLFYLNAGCAHQATGRVDDGYIERMHNLVDGMRPGVKLLLFAFDRYHNEAGAVNWKRTTFYVPNEYAAEMARRHSRYFEWAASVHPYRADAVAALEAASARGARAVKWLPSAMGIDPTSPRCDRFYQAQARLDLPLITHAGMELAVQGGAEADYNNPLKLRRALDHGVRVVVAHCASLGDDRDLDRGPNGPAVPSFELFARLMDDPRHEGRLFGDISALTQANRAGSVKQVLERSEWHHRLLNGSDYPLPGIMPLFSVGLMVELKLLDTAVAPTLRAIREYNPLLFDFVLKRHLRSGAKTFPPGVFETRPFLERSKA